MARGGKRRRPKKHDNILQLVRGAFASGKYRDTRHASERKAERQISILEVKQVVERGYHEPAKDEFKDEWQAWNYSIRGKTVDQRELRIAVSFDEEAVLLVITSIDLGA